MGLGSGSVAPTMALITAICLLWVYPFCLFHQVSADAYQRTTLSDLDHSSSHPVLCDDYHLYAASNGHVTGAGTSLRTEPLQAIPYERFSAVKQHALVDSLLPASRSASLSSSKELYVLYVVYQI
jgi:hypothetical protein